MAKSRQSRRMFVGKLECVSFENPAMGMRLQRYTVDICTYPCLPPSTNITYINRTRCSLRWAIKAEHNYRVRVNGFF